MKHRRFVVSSTLLTLVPVLVIIWTHTIGESSIKAGVMKRSDPVHITSGSKGSLGINDTIDNVTDTCDAALALDSANALHAAQAIDICRVASGENDWGLVSASWVMADGAEAIDDADYALGHGLLSGFGPNVAVRRGDRLLALSSGTARQPTDPGYVDVANPGFDKGYVGNHPDDFPIAPVSCVGMCPTGGDPHDVAALEVELQVPANAYGLSFNFKFYASDYPNWVCTQYNDLFVAILDSIPAGETDGNIVFDSMGSPITVNASFIEVCAQNSAAPCHTCPLGTAELQGTGFEGHSATRWLTATTSVESGSLIRLRFAIYDSEDGNYDSTVLIDNFDWLREPYYIWLPLVVNEL